VRKRRRVLSSSQARKPINRLSRPEQWSDSARAFVTALELTRLDTPQTKRSRPVDASSPVYSPLSNQIIPPAGVAMPSIEKPQQEDQSSPYFVGVRESGPIRVAPVTFICTLYISLVLGSLLHSWWILGESLLIGLVLTGIVHLSHKREILQALIMLFQWFLFALIWGYIGWLVCDSYLPLIIRCLCALIGFVLGLIVYFLIRGVVNSLEPKRIREFRYCAITTFVDTICISLVFGFLLHSWWILGVSLLVGLVLTASIALSARNNIQITVDAVWLLSALMWSYAGWIILDAHIPSIVHFLCAVVSYVLGFVGYPLAYAILSPIDEKEKAV